MSTKPTSFLLPLLLLTVALLLGGCAAPARQWPGPDYPRVEEGLAAHYSTVLEGRQTASGEPYDRNKLTAAHRVLPFGTVVKVTRLSSRRSVQVRINDRGPGEEEERIIHLSRAAANQIDLIQPGVAPVRVEVLSLPEERERGEERERCPCR